MFSPKYVRIEVRVAGVRAQVLGAAWPFARVRGDLARVRPDRDGPVRG